jgi:hypothetical protein
LPSQKVIFIAYLLLTQKLKKSKRKLKTTNRLIKTPGGIGNLEKIYITDLGHIMFRVWYKRGLFINWKIEKLINYGNSIKEGNI